MNMLPGITVAGLGQSALAKLTCRAETAPGRK